MKVLLVLGLLVAYIFGVSFITKTIERMGRSRSAKAYRVKYISKTLHLTLSLLFLILIFLVFGVEYSQVSLFLSSVFAVIGVALFAQWSILSNITASLIIFFAFPYRVGDKIKIIDGDVEIMGTIEEISLFHVMVRRREELITYPNSLMLQKAVIKNPEESPATQASSDNGSMPT
jgi:small-conductance mechanosensitive channel